MFARLLELNAKRAAEERAKAEARGEALEAGGDRQKRGGSCNGPIAGEQLALLDKED